MDEKAIVAATSFFGMIIQQMKDGEIFDVKVHYRAVLQEGPPTEDGGKTAKDTGERILTCTYKGKPFL